MKIIILDGSQRRNWKEIFNQLHRKLTLLNATKNLDTECIEKNDFLIVHRTDFVDNNGELQSDLAKYIQGKNCYVLFIAGNPLAPLEPGKFPRFYRRKTTVAPNGVDQQFVSGLQRLLPHLEQSPDKPEWSLIEPPPYPEHLVAAYLLQIANERGCPVEVMPHFWEDAMKEYKEYATNVSDDFTLSLEEGIGELKDLFTRIAETVG